MCTRSLVGLSRFACWRGCVWSVRYSNDWVHSADVSIQIVHDIIMGLYSSESRDNVPQIRARFVGVTRKRLDALWDDVPSLMKAGPPQPSPPPHIFGFL